MDDRTRDAGTPVERAAGFELERAIAAWRAGFTSLAGDELDELVDHLREEFRRLVALDLSADEAWLVATHRLGRGPAIESEFAKLGGARRIGTYFIGYLVIGLFLRLAETLADVAMMACFRLGPAAFLTAGAACIVAAAFVLVRWLPSWTAWIKEDLSSLSARKWIPAAFGFSLVLAAAHMLESWSFQALANANIANIGEVMRLGYALTLTNLVILGVFFAASFVTVRRENRLARAASR